MQMLRKAIAEHTGEKERAWPKDIPTAAYGSINLTAAISLLEAVPHLYPGDGIASEHPVNMEELMQG